MSKDLPDYKNVDFDAPTDFSKTHKEKSAAVIAPVQFSNPPVPPNQQQMTVNNESIHAPEEIIAALERLAKGKEDFVVLSSENDFIQTPGSPDDWYMELMMNNKHYQCTDTISFDDLKALFLDFYHGNYIALNQFNWQFMEEVEPGGNTPKSQWSITRIITIIVFILIIIIWAYWNNKR